MRLVKKQIDFDQVFEQACAQNGIILDKENAHDRSVKIIDERGKAVIVNDASDVLLLNAEMGKVARTCVKNGVGRRLHLASKTVEEQRKERVKRRKQMLQPRKSRKKYSKRVH